MTHAAHRRSLRDRFLLAAGVCLLTACSGVPLRAAIRRHIQGGRVVYTSRPERNPARVGQRVEPAGRVLPEAPPGLTKLVMASSDRHAIDPALVAAVISVESGFDAMAVSPKGARGLMQLMPSTAREYGVSDIHDPAQNIEGGV
ncbi:MAG: transglycosylase SLT domain-containing protein, partial [Acidobacteriota bacterium]